MNRANYKASNESPSPHFPSKTRLPVQGSVYFRKGMGTEGSKTKSRITPLVGMNFLERRNSSPPPPSSSNRPWYTLWLNWMRIPGGGWGF